MKKKKNYTHTSSLKLILWSSYFFLTVFMGLSCFANEKSFDTVTKFDYISQLGEVHFENNQLIFLDKHKPENQLTLEFTTNQNIDFSGITTNEGQVFRNTENSQEIFFSELNATNILEGVDLKFYETSNGLLEYDFIVQPYTDYKPIAFQFKEATKVEIDKKTNDLLVHYNQSIFRQQAPFTYQVIDGEKVEIRSAYKLNTDGSIGFELLDNYNTELTLIIDPIVLDWGTYLPAPDTRSSFHSNNFTKTSDGCIIYGGTYNPLTATPFSTSYDITSPNASNRGIFVYKVCKDSNTIDWTVSIAGEENESTGVNINELNNGNVAITFNTLSCDLPTTDGSDCGLTSGSPHNKVYTMILDPTGTTLVAASYIASQGFANSLIKTEVAPNGNLVYLIDVSGNSNPTTGLPVSANAYDGTFDQLAVNNSGSYIAIYDPALNFVDATYFEFLGERNAGVDILPLSNGEILLLGQTSFKTTAFASAPFAFPATNDSYNTTPPTMSKGQFGWVAAFSSDLSTLTHASYGAIAQHSDITNTYVSGGFFSFNQRFEKNLYEGNGYIYTNYNAGYYVNPSDPNGAGSNNWVVRFPLSDYSQVEFLIPLNQGGTSDYNIAGLVGLSDDGELIAVSNNQVTTQDAMSFSGFNNINIYDDAGVLVYGTYTDQGFVQGFNKVCFTDCGFYFISTALAGDNRPYLSTNALDPYNDIGFIYSFSGLNQSIAINGHGYVQHYSFAEPTANSNSLLNTAALEANAYCIDGIIDVIDGSELDSNTPDSVLFVGAPVPYPNQDLQNNAFYWEYSSSSTGPWSLIPGSVGEDFAPPFNTQAGTTCYRRVHINPLCPEDGFYPTNPVCITIDNYVAPTIGLESEIYACPNETLNITASVTPSIDGDFPPYNYSWTPQDFLSAGPDPITGTLGAGGGTIGIDVLVPPGGIYYQLEITDSRGCTIIEQVNIIAFAPDVGQDSYISCGESPEIGPTLSDPNIFSYLWIANDGDDSVISSTTVQNPIIDLSAWASNECRTFSLQVNNCVFIEDQVEICKAAPPIAPESLPALELCEGIQSNLGGTFNYNLNYSYTWTPFLFLGQASNPQTDILPLNPGTYNYQLTIENPANGCVTYLNQPVTVHYLPRTGFSQDYGLYCSTVEIGTPATAPELAAGIVYTWEAVVYNIDGSNGNTPTNTEAVTFLTSSTDPEVSTSIPDEYQTNYCYDIDYIRISTNPDSGGVVCERRDTATVHYCPCGTGGPGGYCELDGTVDDAGYCGSADQALTLGAGNYTTFEYTWSPVTDLTDIDGNPLSPTGPHTLEVIANPSSTTTYNITATNIQYPSYTCTVDLIVFPALDSYVSMPDQEHSVCAGEPLTIGYNAIAGLEYQWDGEDIDSLSSDIAPMPIFTSAEPGEFIYTITATDTITGCSLESEILITVVEVEGDLGPNSIDFCAGNNGFIANVDMPALPGYTYSWVAPANVSGITVPALSELIFNTTTFTLQITNEQGCSKIEEVTFFETGPPDVPQNVVASTCAGSTLEIGNGLDPDVVNVIWSGPNGFSSTEHTPIVDIPTDAIFPVIYTASVSYIGNTDLACVSVQNWVINELTDLGETFDLEVCNEDPGLVLGPPLATLPDPNNWTYSWDNLNGFINISVTDQITVFPSEPQTYTLTLTHSSGCAFEMVYNVTPPSYQAELEDFLTVCYDDDNPTLSLLVPCPGGCTYFWEGVNGTSTTYLSSNSIDGPTFDIAQAFANNGAGSTYTYSVTVTDGNGCSSIETITITIQGTDDLLAGPDQSICAGDPITIGTIGIPGMTYFWTTQPYDTSAIANMSSVNASQITVSPTQTTVYELNYVDQTGSCSGTDLVTVQVVAENPELATIDINECVINGFSVDLTNTPPIVYNTGISTNYYMDANATVPVYDPTNAPIGNYFIVAESAEGCTTMEEVTVNIDNGPGFIANSIYDCASLEGASILLESFASNDVYDVTAGPTYTGSADYNTATPIPTDGILGNNFPLDDGSITYYTIRVFNEAGCYYDQTVEFQATGAFILELDRVCNGNAIYIMDPNNRPNPFNNNNLTFNWYLDGVWIASSTTPYYSPKVAGMYTVQTQDEDCATFASEAFQVQEIINCTNCGK